MRILHTSDWHLGQHFMGKSREYEHKAFLQWLLYNITEHSVDAVIVAGDIFDTSSPPSYARSLYNQFVAQLQTTCCQHLVIIGGNHDSVSTLNESKELFATLNTTVVGSVSHDPKDHLVKLQKADGTIGAIVCAIPYIRPRDVLKSQAGQSGSGKQQALQNAIANYYQTVFEKAKELRNELNDQNLPIVATGHLTVIGGQLSESVRDLYIGTLSAFPVSGFPPADYIALGHLHKAQTLSGNHHIRYSGSPLPLSFDESHTTKQLLLVEFLPEQPIEIKPLIIPTFRSIASLKGTLAEVEDKMKALILHHSSSEISPHLQTNQQEKAALWLEVEITSEEYLTDLQQQVMSLVDRVSQDQGVEVLRIRRKSQGKNHGLSGEAKETLSELKVEDVFERRLEDSHFEEEKRKELILAFREIIQEVRSPDIDKDSDQKKKEIIS